MLEDILATIGKIFAGTVLLLFWLTGLVGWHAVPAGEACCLVGTVVSLEELCVLSITF
jgi:hypothetical protein